MTPVEQSLRHTEGPTTENAWVYLVEVIYRFNNSNVFNTVGINLLNTHRLWRLWLGLGDIFSVMKFLSRIVMDFIIVLCQI